MRFYLLLFFWVVARTGAFAGVLENSGPREDDCKAFAAAVRTATGAEADRDFAFRYMMSLPGLKGSGVAVECDAKDKNSALDRVQVYVGSQISENDLFNPAVSALEVFTGQPAPSNIREVMAKCVKLAVKSPEDAAVPGARLVCRNDSIKQVQIAKPR